MPHTHYAPWDDAPDTARCGAPITDDRQHSATPTCPVCAASLVAREDALAALDEAPRPEVEVGAPTGAPLAAELVDDAVALTRRYAQLVQGGTP